MHKSIGSGTLRTHGLVCQFNPPLKGGFSVLKAAFCCLLAGISVVGSCQPFLLLLPGHVCFPLVCNGRFIFIFDQLAMTYTYVVPVAPGVSWTPPTLIYNLNQWQVI